MMFNHIYRVVLVCTAGLAIFTNASFPTVQAKLVLSNPLTLDETTLGVRPNRRLRTGKSGSAFEERTITGLSKIQNWLTKKRENKQLRDWLRAGQTPDDILNLLKVDDEFETFLKGPHYNLLSKFITKYNNHVTIKDPKKLVTMLGLLVKTYGDEAVAKTLEVAKRDPSVEQLAMRIQGDLFVGWAGNKFSTGVVYNRLKVGDERGKDLFATPAFNAWVNFDDMMNHYLPERAENILNQLLTTFDEIPLAKAIELASKDKGANAIVTQLQHPLFEKWVRDGQTTETLGKRLKFDRYTWEVDPSMDILSEYGKFYRQKVLLLLKKIQNLRSAD
ncbi:Secreted RxLR effector peptide protein [Phytophthora palmivora]|uniref:Secreted RxLR effector peptide protein n=1 Tax=Phytophthora palmivora TaxID=4796 RepID=A0A2P4Y989_9STRA|nr:Secreted RxLR effector peptide protein [Phytophthora palmivora]